MREEDLRFGELAIQRGLLRNEQLVECMLTQQRENHRRPISEIAVDRGFMTPAGVQQVLGDTDASVASDPAEQFVRKPSETGFAAVEIDGAEDPVYDDADDDIDNGPPAERLTPSVEALLALYVDDDSAPAPTASEASDDRPADVDDHHVAGERDDRPSTKRQSSTGLKSPSMSALLAVYIDSEEKRRSDEWQKWTDVSATRPVRPGDETVDFEIAQQAALIESSPGEDSPVDIERLLLSAFDSGASDLHLHCGAPPMVRVDGELAVLEGESDVEAEQAEAIATQIASEATWSEFCAAGQTQFALALGARGRARVTVYRQQRGVDLIFRLIPAACPTLDSLGLREAYAQLLQQRTGLALIAGPQGSGKSTTLAALMLEFSSLGRAVSTIEDPIEHEVKARKGGRIIQRQLGEHAVSIARAMRATIRTNPDVIALTNIHDHEIATMAIDAVEAGHLVVGTLPAANCVHAMGRVIDAAPAPQQRRLREFLADQLGSVFCQRLVRKKKGRGRLPAVELLRVTPAVSHMIQDGRLSQIPAAMRAKGDHGAKPLDDALGELQKRGEISEAEARRHAIDPNRLTVA